MFLFHLLVLVFMINGQERVLFKDLEVLTFYKDRLTRTRRVAPKEELVCTGGSGKNYSTRVEVVTCYNKGKWLCEANLSKMVILINTGISCEGYDQTSDTDYIVNGSCRLFYRLELSDREAREYYAFMENLSGYMLLFLFFIFVISLTSVPGL
jgi:hypothetical protein